MFTLALALDAVPGIARGFIAALDFRKPPMRDAAAGASAEMMRFQQRAFRAKSGGGGWPDLAFSTKLARTRRQTGKASARGKIRAAVASVHLPILFDTGTMEAGLFEQGGPGHFQRFTATTVKEGVEGGSHPRFKGTVGALAALNHYGGGHTPSRHVMEQPSGGDLAAIMEPLIVGAQVAAMSLGNNYGQGIAGAVYSMLAQSA